VYAITIHPLKASFPYGCHVMTTRCDIILIQTKQNPQVTTVQTRDLFSRGPRQLHSRCTPVQLTRSYLDAFDLRSRAARRICAAHQPRPRINRDRASTATAHGCFRPLADAIGSRRTLRRLCAHLRILRVPKNLHFQ